MGRTLFLGAWRIDDLDQISYKVPYDRFEGENRHPPIRKENLPMQQLILIGDSIRMGYQADVIRELSGLADVWATDAERRE